ncbi:MAG: 2-C-methyl-D-erythritol 4-phosphate cytidylyltransferase [Desulfomonilaceae bacterium]
MIVGGLITAGGRGQRMGSPVPKQFLDIEGVPILLRTLRVFADHPLIHKIVVTIPPEHADFCREHIASACQTDKDIRVVAGGETRQQSVYYGLECLRDTDVVVIHDGVRPFVARETVTRTIHTAHLAGAAIAAVPVRETVKRKIGENLETVNREGLWFAHTPQSFQTSLILQAHQEALETGFHSTDDASLVERLGRPVIIVEDSYENIKITTPVDLALASLIAQKRFATQVPTPSVEDFSLRSE